MLTATLKPKACQQCKREFMPFQSLQQVCSNVCAKRHAKNVRVAKVKAEKESLKQRMAAVRKPSEARRAAQEQFNKWIRLVRDADKPCISCGITNPPMTPGGQWDAGHFLSRGAYPELAFVEDNCHKQCKSCNGGGGKFKHKERTVNAKYEANLIERIGPDRVAALKAPHPPAKLKAADYDAIAEEYRARLRQAKETT